MPISDHASYDMPTLPPFRVIAIVDSRERIRRACGVARLMGELGLGVMLRDPEHRADRVIRLAEMLADEDLPPNVVPISNGLSIEGIPYLHFPACLSVPAVPGIPGGQPFGVSAHTVSEAVAAARAGASYIMVSPIFPTSSKPGHPGISLDGLREIISAVHIPAFALGGVTSATIEPCLRAGAYGIAGISLFDSIDPERFLDELHQHFNP